MITRNYMNTIVPRSLWIAPLAALALLGAGCFSPDPAPAPVTPPATPPVTGSPTTPTTPPTTPPVTSGGETTEPTTTVPTSTAPTAPTGPLAPIDATWKTYTNASLKFSFQYPTRGRYAPTWGVTFVKTDDAKMQDGCYQGAGSPRQNTGTLFVGDKKFCVTRYEEGAAGQRYLTDYYATEHKGTIVLITFSKQFTNGDNFEDEACHGKLVVASGNTCTPVDVGVYNATLDQVVGTFTHE